MIFNGLESVQFKPDVDDRDPWTFYWAERNDLRHADS
jgi:hypothetical protein